MRFMNRNAARTMPISMANTRSKITVMKKVAKSTSISLLGACRYSKNSLQSLIL